MGRPYCFTERDLRIHGKKKLYPLCNHVSLQRFSSTYKSFLVDIDKCTTPKSVSEALQDPRWKEAMDQEMDALIRNQTWNLVTLPADKKTVGCRWVYTIKHKAEGSVERFKARLVAKGYT